MRFIRTVYYKVYPDNPEATEISRKIAELDGIWKWVVGAGVISALGMIGDLAVGATCVALVIVFAGLVLLFRYHLNNLLKEAIERGRPIVEQKAMERRAEEAKIYHELMKTLEQFTEQTNDNKAEEETKEPNKVAPEIASTERINPEVKLQANELLNNIIHPKIKRAFLFIEDSEWKKADKYLEDALDEEPTNPYAYLGKLMIDLRVTKIEEIRDYLAILDENKYFQIAVRFADKNLKDMLLSIKQQAINDKR